MGFERPVCVVDLVIVERMVFNFHLFSTLSFAVVYCDINRTFIVHIKFGQGEYLLEYVLVVS